MRTGLLKYAAFYLAVFLGAFRLGWWASDRLSSYAQEIDSRIERKYTR
ncbi:Uncharacterised protein [Mycobacteroides abscessus subsp. abscessus]|nr:Uncharacterised protein [Mycobacteroides abscessus subsp. abscessus]